MLHPRGLNGSKAPATGAPLPSPKSPMIPTMANERIIAVAVTNWILLNHLMPRRLLYTRMRTIPVENTRGGIPSQNCLLYTSDAADDLLCVDLGGRRIIKKKKKNKQIIS